MFPEVALLQVTDEIMGYDLSDSSFRLGRRTSRMCRYSAKRSQRNVQSVSSVHLGCRVRAAPSLHGGTDFSWRHIAQIDAGSACLTCWEVTQSIRGHRLNCISLIVDGRGTASLQ